MAGLTETGFSVKTIDEILDEISTSLKDNIDPNLDTDPESVLGQLVGIFAERERILWLLLRDIWSAFTPGGSSGFSLTQLALLTGTKRLDATFSTVTATVNLNAGTTLPAGSQANVTDDPDSVFETLTEVENTGGTPANFPVDMRATVTGPVRAPAGTLEEITTPVVGWNTVTNALDAVEGENAETDPDLRERRELEIRAQGSSNLDAIIADVDQVEGVLDVAGTEDLEDHTFNIVIWDGVGEDAEDNEVAQKIWESKPAGIESTGSESGTAVDEQGEDRAINFDRASQVPIYFEVDLTINPDTYPGDGDTQVKQAMVDYANENYTIGSDVVPSALYGSIHAISGVISIDEIRLEVIPSPSLTVPISVSNTQIAIVTAANIDVATTP